MEHSSNNPRVSLAARQLSLFTLKRRDGRKIKFAECIAQLPSSCSKKVRQDIMMRWNSTYLLFEDYVSRSTASTSNQSSLACDTSGGNQNDPVDVMDEFDVFESQECGLRRVKSKLDLYLEEPRLERKKNVDLDILCYWKANSSRYPNLSFMARDILSILITTVASESAFSIGGRIVDKYRSSFIPKNVEALLCTRDWQYNATGEQNIVVEDLEEEEEELVEDFGERVAALGII